MIWLGLGMMSIQVGVMAHLTWFAYSWDIVEPISYFVVTFLNSFTQKFRKTITFYQWISVGLSELLCIICNTFDY